MGTHLLPPRRREDKPQRREQIIDAAEIVFRRKGYAETNMGDIARQAKVSRPLLYVHFDNKQTLHFAICVRALDLLRERFEAVAAPQPTGHAKLYAIGREYVAFAHQRPAYFSALSHLESHQQTELPTEGVEREMLNAGKAVHAVTIAAIEQGQQDGSVRSDLGEPVMAALSLWSFCHGMIQVATSKPMVLANMGVSPEQFTEASLKMALRGLAPGAGPHAGAAR